MTALGTDLLKSLPMNSSQVLQVQWRGQSQAGKRYRQITANISLVSMVGLETLSELEIEYLLL